MTIENPKIIKEYDDVYFIYKPAFWNCTTGKDYIKELNYKNENYRLILTWIQENIKIKDELNKLDFGYGLMNRLDFETSGIIMVAKTLKSYLKYTREINNHIKTTKIYLTLVDGQVEHEFGIIKIPLYIDKIKRVTSIDENKGKFAYTEYIKLQTLEYKKKIYTLLLVKIKTGRTHQIRVHLKSIGHEVICDKKYEHNKAKLKEQCEVSSRLFLHSQYYKIEDDVDGFIKIPVDLDNTLNKMKLVKQFTNYNNALDILKSNIITDNFINEHEKKIL